MATTNNTIGLKINRARLRCEEAKQHMRSLTYAESRMREAVGALPIEFADQIIAINGAICKVIEARTNAARELTEAENDLAQMLGALVG